MSASNLIGFLAAAAFLYAAMAFNQADWFAVALAVLVAFVLTVVAVALSLKEKKEYE